MGWYRVGIGGGKVWGGMGRYRIEGEVWGKWREVLGRYYKGGIRMGDGGGYGEVGEV